MKAIMMRTCLLAGLTLALAACDANERTSATADAEEALNAAAAGPATPEAADKPLAIEAAAPDLKWGGCPPGMPEGCEIAVLRGDPAKPNADVLLRVPGGSTIAPHWHTSSERIVLLTGQLAVKYQGADEALLNPNGYAFGPARLPHKADCKSADPCTLFIAFDRPVDRHSFEGEI